MSNLIFKFRVLYWWMLYAFDDYKSEVWRRDLDDLYCCDGRECCCGGETVRDLWSQVYPHARPATTEDHSHD